MSGTLAHDDTGLLQAVQQLRLHNAQLERALESRVVIEQAKGILAERYSLTVEDAFSLLRGAARTSRTRLHTLAARVVAESTTPAEIELARAKQPTCSR